MGGGGTEKPRENRSLGAVAHHGKRGRQIGRMRFSVGGRLAQSGVGLSSPSHWPTRADREHEGETHG